MAISEDIVLNDGVSGPATDAASAVDSLTASLGRARDANGRFVSAGTSIAPAFEESAGAADAMSNSLGRARASFEQVQAAAQQIRSSVASGGASITDMAAGLERMNRAANTNGFGTQLDRVKQAESAITGELNKQLALEAKIATFNADRVRQTASLEKQYKSLVDEATGVSQPSGGGGMDSALNGMAERMVGAQAVVGAIEKCIEIEAKMVEVAGELLVQGAKFAIDATEFHDQTIAAFDTIAKTQGGAEKLYQKAIDLSSKLNVDKGKVVDEFKRLAGEGFGEDEIARTIEAIANVDKARSGGGAKFEKVVETLKDTNKMDNGVLKQLAKLGFDEGDMMKQLESVTHKTGAEVKAALKKGAIDGNDAIKAILAAEEAKFGGLAAKAGDSVDGLLNQIKNELQRAFTLPDSAIKPIKDFLKDVETALKGKAGQELTQSITHLFTALFGSLKEVGGKTGPAAVIEKIAHGIDKVAGAIEVVGPIAVATIEKIIAAFDWMGDHIVLIAALTAVIWLPFAMLAIAIGIVVAGVWLLVEAFDAVVGLGEEVFGGLGDAISSAWEGAKGAVDGFLSVGEEIINGIVDGIENGVSSVIDAVVNVAKSAVNAAKDALGINSPSKVFHDLAGGIPEGAANGIDAGTPHVTAAVQRMSKGAIDAASLHHPGMAPANSNGGGIATPSARGNTSNVYNFHASPPAIHMPAGATPEQAQELGKTAGKAAHEELRKGWVQMMRDFKEAG